MSDEIRAGISVSGVHISGAVETGGANIRAGVSLSGRHISGAVSKGGGAAVLEAKTATPTESQQTISPDEGYDGLSSVTVEGIPSNYVGSGVPRKASADLTASGATVTAPAGYYAQSASKSVASGTEGTPTASKGAVSNHAVTVTPSVTNTEGYISGGTKTGTGVTVSASELVSGSETKTANGTYDVTNLAELVVNVPASGGKAAQVYAGRGSVSTTSYTATGVKLTVGKTGTYDVYWSGWRSSAGGTNGSQLYINGSAYGTVQTTFANSYGQVVHLSGVSLTAGEEIELYARARGTSYNMNVCNLVIIES